MPIHGTPILDPYAATQATGSATGVVGSHNAAAAQATSRHMLAATYATDEDVFVTGSGDFGTIVPESNLFAAGADGAFDPSALWTLTSASSNFSAQGVLPGMVIKFTMPASAFNPPQYLAVEAVDGHSLGLRRCGMASAVGQPPSPPGGLASVKFRVLTLLPQIEESTYTLNERYALDPALSGRKPSDIYDIRIFRRLICLWVLYQQYANLNRQSKGDFNDKITFYKDEYESALATATLRWGATGQGQSPTTRFSTKLLRG